MITELVFQNKILACFFLKNGVSGRKQRARGHEKENYTLMFFVCFVRINDSQHSPHLDNKKKYPFCGASCCFGLLPLPLRGLALVLLACVSWECAQNILSYYLSLSVFCCIISGAILILVDEEHEIYFWYFDVHN